MQNETNSSLTVLECSNIDLVIQWSIMKYGSEKAAEMINNDIKGLFVEFNAQYQAFYEKSSKMSKSAFTAISKAAYIAILQNELNKELA